MRINSTILIAALVASAAVAVPATAAQADTIPSVAVGHFYPVSPARILDTRTGNGATKAPIGSGGVLHLQVAGRGGVPSSDVSAAVFNVTVVSPTVNGYLTVYPGGSSQPNASSLNFPKGWTGSNSVTVKLGDNGQVDIYNSAGNTNVVVDVTGYFAASDALVSTKGVGGGYIPTDPSRVMDTRTLGDNDTPLPVPSKQPLPVLFSAAHPENNAHIRAIAVNITVVNPTVSGYVTAYDGRYSGSQVPPTSTVNFAANVVTSNFAVVPVSMCDWDPVCYDYPMISVFNGASKPVHVIVDIFGAFDDNTGWVEDDGSGNTVILDGLRFHPTTPTRIVDSRSGLGTPRALGAKTTATITTPTSVTNDNTVALAMNVTAVSPTANTYLTVWPWDGTSYKPDVSNLNPSKGQTVPNAVWTGVGGDQNKFNVFNYGGTTNVVIDVNGTFDVGDIVPAGTQASALAPQKKMPNGTLVPVAPLESLLTH